MKRSRLWPILFGVGIFVAAGVFYGVRLLSVDLPNYPKVEKTVWLDQNWSPADRSWMHHADQGTMTFGIPYEWFAALEQPTFTLTAGPPFISSDYLDRFGFIPGAPAEVPVGFARGGEPVDPISGQTWTNPKTNQPLTSIGLTCAACHTGRFTYKGTAVLIDGGPALTDLGKFRKALGLALLFTRHAPFRFERFAAALLGPDADADVKAELSRQLDAVLAKGGVEIELDKKVAAGSIEEGYSRLDALNRIGNQVFSLDLDAPENYAAISAPVNFPQIWDASWFDWVQYNASIEQPMVRNAGEALGVRALVNLTNGSRSFFASTAKIETIFQIERLLAGEPPNPTSGFTGLHSPRWPSEIFPPVRPELAAKGAELYRDLCQGCHRPPVQTAAFWDPRYWTEQNSTGERYLRMPLVDLDKIGTDAAQAEGMAKRIVKVPAVLAISSDKFGAALGDLVEKTIIRWYDSQTPPIPPTERGVMNGNRGNGIRAPLAYKARPLDGVWATPPFLHNGSVPTIDALLSPAAERPARFWLGGREYDPVKLGYRSDEKVPGGFEFDTSLPGNRNTGHEFDDVAARKGIIGRRLTAAERAALIEYLKTL